MGRDISDCHTTEPLDRYYKTTKRLFIEQAKRCTQDKIGFAAMVDRVVANSTPWQQDN